MNVQALKQTSVIQTLHVTTPKDPTHVAVSVAIRAMGKTAQVNICMRSSDLKYFRARLLLL